MSKSPFDVLKSMMCNASSHRWSGWVTDGKSCTTRRHCERCKAEETQEIDHTWGEWRLFPHQCVQVRVCSRCSHRETRDVEHEWSDWFINEECLEVRKCNHCGTEQQGSKKPKHSWAEWKSTQEYNCGNGKKIRECERCHQTEKSTSDLIHTCKDWKILKEKCQKQSRCQMCGELVYLPEHTWGSWRVKDSICVEVRECLICGELEYSEIKNTNDKVHHDFKLVNSTIKSTRYYAVSDNQNTWHCEWECKRCGFIEFNEYDDWVEDAHPPD